MISVCIATYNGQDYIEKQLRSILFQLSPNDQVVVSDDCSNDRTIEIISSIRDPRIEIYYNAQNVGYTANFEKAISYAVGDVVFLSDQDDIWLPNKVAVCLNFLKEYDLVVSDAKLCNSKGEIISNSFYGIRKPKKTKFGNILKFGYLGCCMAFKRHILEKATPFPSNHKMATHDNWIFLVGMCFYKTKIIDDPLIIYRRHNDNVSSGGLTKTTSILFKVKYRLYILKHLILRKWSR